MPEAVRFEVDERVATITLNRPEKMNAINRAMRKELYEAFVEVKNNPDIWVAILTGEGRAFTSGKDLFENVPEDGTVVANEDLFVYLRHVYKPFVAALNGPCYAQGGGLALSCDIRIMSERATLGWPQVRVGMGSMTGPAMFAHEVPRTVAAKYLLRGVPLTAEEALKYDVVHEVVPHDELMNAARRWSRELLLGAPLAIAAIKEVMVRTEMMPLAERLILGNDLTNRSLLTEDAKEGLAAFKEKRAPIWKGR